MTSSTKLRGVCFKGVHSIESFLRSTLNYLLTGGGACENEHGSWKNKLKKIIVNEGRRCVAGLIDLGLLMLKG